jgi:hypothetical protein
MITSSKTVAMAAILAVFAISSVAVPASARDGQTPGFDTCFALSVERGSGPNKGGTTKEEAQHRGFMADCMAGKIPLKAEANSSGAKLPPNSYASTVVQKPTSRHPVSGKQPAKLRAGGER